MNFKALSLTLMVGVKWWWCDTCDETLGVSDCLAGSPRTTFGPVSLVSDAKDALPPTDSAQTDKKPQGKEIKPRYAKFQGRDVKSIFPEYDFLGKFEVCLFVKIKPSRKLRACPTIWRFFFFEKHLKNPISFDLEGGPT